MDYGWIYTLSVCMAILSCFYASLLIHEAGHLYCARIFSIKTDSIILGTGPTFINFPINNVHFLLKAIPSGAFIKFDTECEKYITQQLFDKVCISLSGPLASICTALFTLVFLLSIKGIDVTQQLLLFFSFFKEYEHIPGIPYILYAFFLLIADNHVNIFIVFAVVNFFVFMFSLLPVLEQDMGKTIFNVIHYFDKALEGNIVLLFLVISGCLKHSLHLTVLFLSTMDVYRFYT